MQNYELLFILPGTISEDEVPGFVDQVKTLVKENGGEEINMKDLGKSRIAYPIKHIRYGYFNLCFFQAEPKNVAEINRKLRLLPDLLRVLVQKSGAGALVPDKISAISDVTVRENRPRPVVEDNIEKEKAEDKPEEHIALGHQMDSSEKKAKKEVKKTKTETKVEDIKMEDIDKKLDELLEANIADV